MAYKAEHAADLENGAVVAVTLQGADLGDTTTVNGSLQIWRQRWTKEQRSFRH
jgi:hypothetical protein